MKSNLLFSIATLLLIAMCGGSLSAQTWEKVTLSELTSDDVFVIVDSVNSVAMSNDGGTSSLPSCVSVTLNDDGDKIAGSVADSIKWNLKDTTYSETAGYIFYPNGTTATWLYGATTSNAKSLYVGTVDSAKVFVEVDTTYSSATCRTLYCPSVGRYVGLNSTTDWRSYSSINTNVGKRVLLYFKYNASGSAQTTTTLSFATSSYTFKKGSGEQTISDNAATITPSEATGSGDIVYTSSDSTIAVPASDGTVTVYTTAVGSAIITATYAENDSYYGSTASYTIEVAYSAPDGSVGDTITTDNLAATSSTYTTFTYTSEASGLSYKGNSAYNSGNIQLRSTNSNAGIVSTSAAKLLAVTIVFNSSTTSGRTVDVYGNTVAYTSSEASDLYSSSTQGTKIGSAAYDGSTTSYTIEVGDDDVYYYAGIRSNSSALYLEKVIFYWDGSVTVIGEEDATTKKAAEATDVTLIRTLSSEYLNTFCVPFDITADQISSVLGSDATVQEFSSVSGTTLTFETAESITAGKPYLVQPSTTVTNPTFESVTIVTDGPSAVTIDDYSFTGIYLPKDLATDSTEVFLATDGKLYYPADDDYTMPGLRGYFTLPKTADTEAVKISLTIDGVTDDSEATGISAVDAQAETTTGIIYTVSGQRAGNSLEALPSGLYIIGGKKVIVK